MTAGSASAGMFVTHLVRRWLGRFSTCLFPIRCHVTSPSLDMSSHRVTVVSAKEHSAFIGLFDRGDATDVRTRTLCSSKTASGTRSHRKSDARIIVQTVSSLQVSTASPLTSATVVSCRSQPQAFRSTTAIETLGSFGK